MTDQLSEQFADEVIWVDCFGPIEAQEFIERMDLLREIIWEFLNPFVKLWPISKMVEWLL